MCFCCCGLYFQTKCYFKFTILQFCGANAKVQGAVHFVAHLGPQQRFYSCCVGLFFLSYGQTFCFVVSLPMLLCLLPNLCPIMLHGGLESDAVWCPICTQVLPHISSVFQFWFLNLVANAAELWCLRSPRFVCLAVRNSCEWFVRKKSLDKWVFPMLVPHFRSIDCTFPCDIWSQHYPQGIVLGEIVCCHEAHPDAPAPRQIMQQKVMHVLGRAVFTQYSLFICVFVWELIVFFQFHVEFCQKQQMICDMCNLFCEVLMC